MKSSVEAFLTYARKREHIKLARLSGKPAPWTDDPILQEYRFCNVYREDDKVTQWFRENIRGPLRDTAEVLYATVMFRWFNKIETAQRLIGAHGLGVFMDLHPEKIRETLTGVSPIVTGSYIIKTPNGMNKLEGLIWCLEQIGPFCLDQAGLMLLVQKSGDSWSLQDMHNWLMQFPFLGHFMAYEVVTDLRHTSLLERAPDILTWANAGPGAQRGLNRIHGRPLDKAVHPKVACAEMHEILLIARAEGWADWEMREVEHGLCEFDKYERTRLGEGTPKQRFKPA